jgi:hypothetical protein
MGHALWAPRLLASAVGGIGCKWMACHYPFPGRLSSGYGFPGDTSCRGRVLASPGYMAGCWENLGSMCIVRWEPGRRIACGRPTRVRVRESRPTIREWASLNARGVVRVASGRGQSAWALSASCCSRRRGAAASPSTEAGHVPRPTRPMGIMARSLRGSDHAAWHGQRSGDTRMPQFICRTPRCGVVRAGSMAPSRRVPLESTRSRRHAARFGQAVVGRLRDATELTALRRHGGVRAVSSPVQGAA